MDTTGYPADPAEVTSFPAARTAAWSALAARMGTLALVPSQNDDGIAA
ncbi:hypothetical protein [Cellulomonas sp. HZM]|nr:hypothetical protein [Cellulomonas sp. HZM]